MARDDARAAGQLAAPTDDMVAAAHARIHKNVHEDFHFPTPICVQEALAAALAAAPTIERSEAHNGRPVWVCIDHQAGSAMIAERDVCEEAHCSGRHHVLIVGPEQPQPDGVR